MVVNTISPGAKKQAVIVVHDLTASVTDTGGQTDVIPMHFSKAFDKVSGLNLIFIKSKYFIYHVCAFCVFVYGIHVNAPTLTHVHVCVCVCVCVCACVRARAHVCEC